MGLGLGSDCLAGCIYLMIWNWCPAVCIDIAVGIYRSHLSFSLCPLAGVSWGVGLGLGSDCLEGCIYLTIWNMCPAVRIGNAVVIYRSLLSFSLCAFAGCIFQMIWNSLSAVHIAGMSSTVFSGALWNEIASTLEVPAT